MLAVRSRARAHGLRRLCVVLSSLLCLSVVPLAATAEAGNGGLGQRAVREAARHYGAPYQYGAAGPRRFDCSGLTLYVYRRFGRHLPHNAAGQYRRVRHVSKRAMRPGDLIFFYGRGGIHHVGIYAGGHSMWDASHRGTVVHRRAIWSSRFVVGRP